MSDKSPDFNYVLFNMTELVPLRRAIYHGEELIHTGLITEQWVEGFLKALAITKVSYNWGVYEVLNFHESAPETFKEVLALGTMTFHAIPDHLRS